MLGRAGWHVGSSDVDVGRSRERQSEHQAGGIVDGNGLTWLDRLVVISHASTVWSVAAGHVETLSRSVIGVETDPKSDLSAADPSSAFKRAQQSCPDPLPAIVRQNVEVGNLRNLLIAKRRIVRGPHERAVAREILAYLSEQADPLAGLGFGHVALVERGRLVSADPRERRGDPVCVSKSH